jgi:hypothetical protein
MISPLFLLTSTSMDVCASIQYVPGTDNVGCADRQWLSSEKPGSVTGWGFVIPCGLGRRRGTTGYVSRGGGVVVGGRVVWMDGLRLWFGIWWSRCCDGLLFT